MPNLKNSISSSVAQHPVLFKYLAICYLQRPVPELRLCAGTLRITRSQRPALGHLAIIGGGEVETLRRRRRYRRRWRGEGWQQTGHTPPCSRCSSHHLLLTALPPVTRREGTSRVIIVPVLMSGVMSAPALC